MSVNKNHPNYTKHPALKGKVVMQGSGLSRSGRRGGKLRNLPKQFHVQGAQVQMMMIEKGLLKRPK